MEANREPVEAGWLTESRKDAIAGGLFILLGIAAVVFFRLNHIPLNVSMPDPLGNFPHHLFFFRFP